MFLNPLPSGKHNFIIKRNNLVGRKNERTDFKVCALFSSVMKFRLRLGGTGEPVPYTVRCSIWNAAATLPRTRGTRNELISSIVSIPCHRNLRIGAA